MWKAIKIYFRICEAIYAILGMIFTFFTLWGAFYTGLGNYVGICADAGEKIIEKGKVGAFEEY